MKILVILLLMVSASQFSWAQSLEEQRLASQTKFNFLNDMTLDTNAQKTSTVDDVSSLTYVFGLKYKLDKKSSMWIFARAAKNFAGEETFGLLDTIVRYERSVGNFQGFSNRLRLSAVLPTNEKVHETTSFDGALSGQLRSGRSLSSKLYLNLINTLRWNFHQFRVSEVAGINIQSTFSSLASLSYTLNSKIIFSAAAGATTAKTYKNNLKYNYLYDLAASYNITNKASVTAGFGTNASATKADGSSSNLRAFDERDTGYYLNLSYFY